MLDLRNTPVSKIISIDDNLVTLECVCGRTFTVADGLMDNLRCEVCNDISDNLDSLPLNKKRELAMYMYETIMIDYINKFTRY